MSKEAVEAIIGKAVLDSEFREALFADPKEALAGYDLTGEEVAALRAIDAEEIASFAGALDERISKAFIVGSSSRMEHSWDPDLRRPFAWQWNDPSEL